MSNEENQVKYRSALVLGLLGIILAGCGGTTSAPSPTAAPTAPPKPTVPPIKPGRVLLKLAVHSMDFTSRPFTSSDPGWKLYYNLKCTNPGMLSRSGMFFMATAIDPKHPNGKETLVVYSLGRVPKGASDLQQPGTYRLRVISYAGCNWHVTVRNQVRS